MPEAPSAANWHQRWHPVCLGRTVTSENSDELSLFQVMPTTSDDKQIIYMYTTVASDSTCKVIQLWISFAFCCWTYHLEQFTWISAWSWTFNRLFLASVKAFLFAQYWRRHSRALETFVPSHSINLLFTLFTLHYIYINTANAAYCTVLWVGN